MKKKNCDINNVTSPISNRRRILDMIYYPSSVLTINQRQFDTTIR